MPLNTGQILQQRYRIDALLGQGGMGTVYRATDLNLGIPVVVKENLIHSSEAQRQFEREARILAAMRHPNLPRVSDHFFIPGQGQYLVMDYVEGEDLNQIIARSGTIPEDQALAWIGQILDALAYLHSRQIIHRDVKPANVKITLQGQVFLVDFGLAKVYDLYQRTSTGARGVTPGYAPPEQYGQGRTDTRSDVYAVGATLYTALTGQVPPDSVDLMVGSEILSPPRQSTPSISPQTEQVVLKSMESRPADRYQSSVDLRQALSTPAATRQLPGRGPGPTPAASARRRVPVGLWVVGGVLLALAVVVGAWLWLGPGSGGNPEPTDAPVDVVAVTLTPVGIDTDQSSPEPSVTPSPSSESEPTETRIPTSVPVLVASASLTPAATITPLPTQTPTEAPTMTPSPALTPTPRPTKTPAPTATAASPPARNQIAFESWRGGNSDIYVINTDGSNERRLTSDPGRDQSPSWSPDGLKIAFEAGRDGNLGIFVMNADGTSMQRLTTGDHHSPAWSPDGKRIAVGEGYVMNADGSGFGRVFAEKYTGPPTWSPDGGQIAYSAWSGGNSTFVIWVVNSDGTNERRLTFPRLETATTDRDPAWSPDGKQIAFASDGDGVWGINVMNDDGSGIRRLTDHGDKAAAPAWSRDGSRIAFSTRQDDTNLIYVMNADGSNLQYLAQGTEPTWSP